MSERLKEIRERACNHEIPTWASEDRDYLLSLLDDAIKGLRKIERGEPGPPLNRQYTSQLALATWTASTAQHTARAVLAKMEGKE